MHNEIEINPFFKQDPLIKAQTFECAQGRGYKLVIDAIAGMREVMRDEVLDFLVDHTDCINTIAIGIIRQRVARELLHRGVTESTVKQLGVLLSYASTVRNEIDVKAKLLALDAETE